MWMLTFNVVLGYQGLLCRDFLWIFLEFFFFFFFNPTDRSTQHQKTHSTLNDKRRGDGLSRVSSLATRLHSVWHRSIIGLFLMSLNNWKRFIAYSVKFGVSTGFLYALISWSQRISLNIIRSFEFAVCLLYTIPLRRHCSDIPNFISFCKIIGDIINVSVS